MSDANDVWSRLILEAPEDPVTEQLLSALLFDLGAQGVETQSSDTLADTRLDAVPVGSIRLIAFFEGLPEDLSRVRSELLSRSSALGASPTQLRLEPYDDTSWLHGWKAFFKPARVSERLAVRPPWEDFDAPRGVHTLVIEPGMAFGTGLHDTTRLCLTALDALTAEASVPRMLDVGCGSGVLSIAARMLGVPEVLGTDVDPIAAEVSEENARLNGTLEGSRFTTTPVDAIQDGPFPLVVANILAHILRAIREPLTQQTAPGGVLLLSGLLEREADSMTEAFTAGGLLSLEATTRSGEWVALRLRKAASNSGAST